ncbi:ZIP metal ion transporter-like protein [Cucurbitaria berberidis CBS 394.84]|uniref:ZIP metal ion transporter-like protein n=1 Tax=Cucurbitaria berberidis CBS 394.84 TaxID=1168544 RepID=A0A9P4LAC6_9PLEO|nr:ZIP metal ion transporter-like protein [Cucurbitaria berberidis CBS 394.84]KAF1847328.1 ZIP metal ion transporter-like protein [Cucurbitaria berberidis CBS 394.84]
MWDGLFMLLALSTIMGIASFLAGIVPLSFSLSPRQLRIFTLLGTGVLVGTSLIVIIPEGIETLYSAGAKARSQDARVIQPTIPSLSGSQTGVKHPAEFPTWRRSDVVDTTFLHGGAVKASTGDVPGDKAIIDLQVKKTKDTKDKEKEKAEEAHPQKGGDDDSTEGHKEGHTRVHAPEDDEESHSHLGDGYDEKPGPHAYIGVALILGYILMFLVDHLPEALSSAKPKYQPMHISLSNLARGPHNSSSLSLNGMGAASNAVTPLATPGLPPSSSKKTPSATIGLIVHACADGIALGASSTAPSTSLSLVIFFAIMLHKAPAAFGLTSVLLKQGLSKRRARTHLAFFSLAAPAGALATWAIVHLFGRNRLGGDDGLTWTTGWVLCFSGGTFLYVAMQSMSEATSSHLHEDPIANSYMDAYPGGNGLSKTDIAIVMFGMLLPLVSQMGHAHSHGH